MSDVEASGAVGLAGSQSLMTDLAVAGSAHQVVAANTVDPRTPLRQTGHRTVAAGGEAAGTASGAA